MIAWARDEILKLLHPSPFITEESGGDGQARRPAGAGRMACKAGALTSEQLASVALAGRTMAIPPVIRASRPVISAILRRRPKSAGRSISLPRPLGAVGMGIHRQR
jgi:hypothetical protein